MKKIIFTLLIVLTAFVSCSKDTGNIKDIFLKYSCDAIPEGVYYIEDQPIAVYPYDNKFYEISYDSGNVGYREPENMEYHLLFNVGEEYAEDIFVDSEGVYTVGDHAVYFIDLSGNLKNKIDLPELETYNCRYCIAASEKYITACCRYNTESDEEYKSVIYVINRDTNEITIYDYKKYNSSDKLEKIIPAKEDEFVLFGNYQVYNFNALNGKTELLYDGSNAYEMDYSAKDNCLYFTNAAISSSIIIGKIQLPDGDVSVTRSIDLEYIFPKIKSCVEATGGTAVTPWCGDVFCTESGYIVWESGNSTACVFSEKVNDTGEEVTVVYRCSQSIETMLKANFDTEFGSMNGVMSRMNTQFEEENKIAVNAKGYAYDKFVENLRIKLLAGDDDYDVVMLEHADELLASILNYGLYLPLETYESISSGFDKYFDGVRDVMSYDGHIYGIPYYLTAYGFTSETDTKDTLDKLSYDYTIDDFWNLCEEFGSTRIMFCTELTNKKPFYYIISSIIEDGMRKGEISRDTLLECIETYMKYREAGSLNLNIPGNGPLRIIGGIGGTLDAKFEEREYKTLRSLPSYDGKRYIDVKSMAYINSKTKNADLAAEYLSMLVSDDYLPWCSNYDKSYLAKDVNSYFYLSHGEDELATEYKKIKVPAGENDYMSECNAFLVENGENLFTNAAPRIYTGCLEDMINEVYNGLNDGKLTAEEAADKIYYEASYQLME